MYTFNSRLLINNYRAEDEDYDVTQVHKWSKMSSKSGITS